MRYLDERGRQDVLIDMPPKLEICVYTPMSLLQRDYYELTLKGELSNQV